MSTSREGQTPPRLPRPALRLLLQAWDYAAAGRHDLWQFAVELDELRSAGLTKNDLRWLVSMGYVQHAVEESPPGAEPRRFGRHGELLLDPRSCFVLEGEKGTGGGKGDIVD